jgi:hypothetical protein
VLECLAGPVCGRARGGLVVRVAMYHRVFESREIARSPKLATK